jgi:hypothetical protein
MDLVNFRLDLFYLLFQSQRHRALSDDMLSAGGPGNDEPEHSRESSCYKRDANDLALLYSTLPGSRRSTLIPTTVAISISSK